jgi:hypothetical protein
VLANEDAWRFPEVHAGRSASGQRDYADGFRR